MTGTTPEHANELKNAAYDLAGILSKFLNENCADTAIALLGLSLVAAHIIVINSDEDDEIREFFDGAVTAGIADMKHALTEIDS